MDQNNISHSESDDDFVEEKDANEIICLQNDDFTNSDDEIVHMKSDEDEEEEEEEEEDDVDTKNDASIVFRKHTGEIYCVRIDPISCSLVATGGKDNKAFVWSLKTGDVLFECKGHDESVISVDFDHTGTMLATGDLNGVIKVWKVETGEEIWQNSVSEIQWLKWHTEGNILMAGTFDGTNGDIFLWEFPSHLERQLVGYAASRCNVGRFMPDGKRACSGYDDGIVRIWMLRNSSCVYKIDAHVESVTAIDCHPDNRLILSASTDNTACLMNADNGQILMKYNHHHNQPKLSHQLNDRKMEEEEEEEEKSGVFAATFSPNFKFVATGTKSGLLTIWESTSHTERHRCHHSAGIERLFWHPNLPFVYTCTDDGKVVLWDARNGQQLMSWSGHRRPIFDMDLSRDASVLVTASYDKTAMVFQATPQTI